MQDYDPNRIQEGNNRNSRVWMQLSHNYENALAREIGFESIKP